MATEEEFHAHRGKPAQRSNGKHCIPDEDRDTSFHQYDDEAGTWTLDCYNARHAKQLVAQGLQPLPSTHTDGKLFAVSTKELIQFLADSENIPIDFPKRRKRILTDEQKQAQSDRMRALNAARINGLI